MARQASRNNSCSVVIAYAGRANPFIPMIADSAQLADKLRTCRKPLTTAARSDENVGSELERHADTADLQRVSPSVNSSNE